VLVHRTLREAKAVYPSDRIRRKLY